MSANRFDSPRKHFTVALLQLNMEDGHAERIGQEGGQQRCLVFGDGWR
jgi:hypothetical protein